MNEESSDGACPHQAHSCCPARSTAAHLASGPIASSRSAFGLSGRGDGRATHYLSTANLRSRADNSFLAVNRARPCPPDAFAT